MSTFIYTLQRKVQELQNTLRSLQEQNANLRNRARMLSEGDPGGPPGGDLQASDEAQYFPNYQTYGGLGSSAFLTRTTQQPGDARNWWEDPTYAGFRIRGVIPGVDFPITNYTNVNGLLLPANQQYTSMSPQVLAEIIILNAMNNPNFNILNFETGQQMLQAFSNLFLGSGAFTQQQITQAGQIMFLNPGFQTWLSTAVKSANGAGQWNVNQNWPF
jgi:hypothetical protein